MYVLYRCLSFCTFSFGHCVVCSLIYGFWLSLWYLQTLLTRCQWIFSLIRREVLTLREHLGSPSRFGGVSVSHLFSFLCWAVFFVLGFSSSCVLCLVWQVLSVSLDCPFLIDPSVFSNVYKWYNNIVVSVLLINYYLRKKPKKRCNTDRTTISVHMLIHLLPVYLHDVLFINFLLPWI